MSRTIPVAIAGCGRYLNGVEKCLGSNVEVLFYLDNDEESVGRETNGRKVLSPYEFSFDAIKYVLIAAYDFDGLRQQLLDIGVDAGRIIAFFDRNIDYLNCDEVFKPLESIQYSNKCHIDRIEKYFKDKISYIYRNIAYEGADYCSKNNVRIPNVVGVSETVNKIIDGKLSVSRYGDGEFEIVAGHGGKDIYQEHDDALAIRLREILTSDVEKHIVALADDYGCMDGLSEQAKDNIRKYMTKEKREEHYKYIDMDKTYYNAYLSRPYVIYPWDDLEGAKRRFSELKKIWDQRDVVFVEGEMTRSGVGNDLFSNANSIKRILAPKENAFRKYNEILAATEKVDRDKLILIALGPTATVLAYDLARKGYWAIDIGHLDLEYEWFLRGKGFSYVRNKYNNELKGDTVTIDVTDGDYLKSVIERVV